MQMDPHTRAERRIATLAVAGVVASMIAGLIAFWVVLARPTLSLLGIPLSVLALTLILPVALLVILALHDWRLGERESAKRDRP